MVMRVGGMSKPELRDGGAHAIARLAHGGVGQADGAEFALLKDDAGEVDLHVDDVGVDAVDGGAAGFEEHIGDRGSA